MGLQSKVQIVLLVFLFGSISCSEPDHYDDDYYNDHPASGYGYHSTDKITKSVEELEPFREIINKWLGHEKAKKILWSRIENHPTYIDQTCYLDVAWVYQETQDALTNTTSGVSSEEKLSVLTQLEKALKQELNVVKSNVVSTPSGNNCTQLFSELKKHRSHLDCALKPEVVTQYFVKMFPPTDCWDFSEGLWSDVQSADLDQCSSTDVYNDLVHVAQIAKGRYADSAWGTHDEEARLRLMADLTETISSPTHYSFLKRITCAGQPEMPDCWKIAESVELAICGPLTITLVNRIANTIKEGSTAHALSDESEVLAMMEILTHLTDIIHILSKDALVTRVPHKVAVGMLQTYMDIIDNTLSDSTDSTWKKMDRSRANKNRQLILVNNDKFVSAAFDLIVSSTKDFNSSVVVSDLMTLYLKRTSKNESSENVGFEFAEAQIKTDLHLNGSSTPLNVHAIHYKSWAELQGESDSKTPGLNQSRDETKVFVGRGGIVSLTAHLNKEKKSVPVSYKMKFGDKVETSEAASAVRYHRCLSCEYLNTESGTWENTGCIVRGADEDGVSCHCNHTTNFAAFMSPVAITINMTDAQYQAKKIVSYVGSGLSVIALAISLIIFNIVRPSIRNDRLKAHINLALALLFVHATQLTVDYAINNDVACLITTVMTQFFLLASFFWMLIEGIFLYLYVVQVFVHSEIKYLRWVFVMGWTIPALIVALSAGYGIPNNTYVDMKEAKNYCEEGQIIYPPLPRQTGSTYERCWLSVKSGMAWSFIGPALLIIVINCAILCKVMQVLVKVSRKSKAMQPFRPPAASSSGGKAEKQKETSYANNTWQHKESESTSLQTPIYYATTETGTTNDDLSDAHTGKSYGATSCDAQPGRSKANEPNVTPAKTSDSPSRFDARIPSQAYMYKRAPYRAQPFAQPASEEDFFLSDVKAAVKGASVLLPILGIPWICGMWISESYVLMMIFLIINSTQGLVILILYCIMNGEVRRALERHFKMMQMRSQSGRSRTSSTSSLRSLNSKMGVDQRRKPSTTISHASNK